MFIWICHSFPCLICASSFLFHHLSPCSLLSFVMLTLPHSNWPYPVIQNQGSAALLTPGQGPPYPHNLLFLGYEEFPSNSFIPIGQLSKQKGSVAVLTLLTLRALALARLISGVSGIIWTEVLSLSQTSLYFGCGKNNNKIISEFVILLVAVYNFWFFWSQIFSY